MLKGTSVLREQNKRKILALVRRYQQTTRKDLLNEMDVSKNTISLAVDELIQDGVLEEIGIKDPSTKGRPKILLQIKANSYKAIGITISKRIIAYSIINFDGTLIDRGEFENDGTNAETTLQFTVQLIDRLLEKYDQIIGIGIGIPGIINELEQKVSISVHLNWKDVTLDHFSRIDIPIFIQNSVNMGAHTAIEDENLYDHQSLFYVRISEGIGGAFILDDVLIPGHAGTAGEIGHISVDAEAPKCRCGQHGCLESLINIEQFKQEMERLDIKWKERNGFFQGIENDETLGNNLAKYGYYLGKSLVVVIHLLNPTVIVIDTPYNHVDSFQNECLHYLDTHSLPRVYKDTAIIFSTKRYDISRGAALSAIINYEKFMY
ncbi:ROK family protein [Siminovitchia sp. 179-K 8D1 HS]|uniref:ROK family transcriptional regulator n=1 Tax=Siminovitchia sp. 179-K 8D1 HS TaxID=3142385 RepID=UPI00399F8E62